MEAEFGNQSFCFLNELGDLDHNMHGLILSNYFNQVPQMEETVSLVLFPECQDVMEVVVTAAADDNNRLDYEEEEHQNAEEMDDLGYCSSPAAELSDSSSSSSSYSSSSSGRVRIMSSMSEDSDHLDSLSSEGDTDNDEQEEVKDPDWVADQQQQVKRPKRRCCIVRSPQKRRRVCLKTPSSTSNISRGSSTPGMPKAKITKWLLLLLQSKAHNPAVLSWEDESQGVFRVMDKIELSRLWGEAKNNPNMNYNNFSRAWRYYYKTKELVSVSKKMLYRFGPKSDFCKAKRL